MNCQGCGAPADASICAYCGRGHRLPDGHRDVVRDMEIAEGRTTGQIQFIQARDFHRTLISRLESIHRVGSR